MNKVYCITNKINNKKYVGFTSMTIPERMGQHRHKARNETKQPIHMAINKYGWDNFDVSVLYEGDDALNREDDFIQEMGDYNISRGGSANQLGQTWTHSKETREKSYKGKVGVKKGNIPWNKGIKTGLSEKQRIHLEKYYAEDREVSEHALYMREYNRRKRENA
ncbi:MAG: GIY-YIG nuclease family protein [Pelagibacteraceae bacterium]|nr:GIY-YIG nuclease family protein [Pelagibacteraceae bacterium]